MSPSPLLRVVEDVDVVRLTLALPPLNVPTTELLEALREALEAAPSKPRRGFRGASPQSSRRPS
jgi:hypothetical protein